MRFRWMLGLLCLLIVPMAADSSSSPQVTLAVPGGSAWRSGTINRFTLRFSDPMVPLGDPRATPAAVSDCPVASTGRWVDQQTFVLDFEKPLPGGVSCAVTLRDDLATLRGVRVAGTRRFQIDTGGPSVRAVLAPGMDGDIDDDQVFLLATNVAADPRSVAARASCAVDGIGESIAVDLLPAGTVSNVLDGLGEQNWRRRSFLEEAGLPAALPKDAKARTAALANVVVLHCRRPLPPERNMALVWPSSITSLSGKVAGRDQRFDFTVRAPFAARLECGRVNSSAGCNPIEDAELNFSAPIDRAKALAIRLMLADGSERKPTLSDDVKSNAQVSGISFKGPFPAESEAKLVLPEGIKDLSGRTLGNAARFPLSITFDAAPPLVKFAAGFGIVEATEGGVLPVTVRSVEPTLIGKATSIAGKSVRIADDNAEIAKWLHRLDNAEDSDFEDIKQPDGTSKTINHTRDKPLLTSSGAAMSVPLPGKGKDFEVVGIPLKKYGFHVVELASPALGNALLGRKVPRYVAAGALVTDMAVHFKWGRESSLVWVTMLETGAPVAHAAIHVTDSCTGKPIVWGSTDRTGRLLIRGSLPEPEINGDCDYGAAHPLMVSARLGEDMSFTLTSWTKGIAPYDFELPFGWEPPQDIIHTIFDRALVKVGESVHMKHVLRHPAGSGFALAKGFSGKLVLSHNGSGTEFTMPVTISADGSGENEWTVPQGAPLGDYTLRFESGARTINSGQNVRVDEYRLPTMRASVSGPPAPLVRPTSVPLSLYAGYLSGGGASNLPVTLRSDFTGYAPGPSGWENYSFGGEAVKPGTRPLDDEGEAEKTPLPYAQTLPAALGADGTAKASIDVNQPVTQPIALTVEMDYPDANGETLTASRRTTLYPSAVQLGVKTDGWLMRDNDLRLQFVALDLSGKPIAGQKIAVKLYSREIITARRRLIGGFYAYDNQEKVTEIDTSCSAKTDSLGRAGCALDPGVSGEVTVVATTLDAEKREARAVRSVWLAGEDDWWFGGDNGDRMDLIPEQNAYKAGDVARFQVRMPFRSATALVTVEREGVLASYVTQLSGKDPVVEVKMPGTYAPNVYVSVMAVRGRIGGWKLWLADLARKWHLPFLSREGASPTALVDLAKPSYRIGLAKVKVGWEAHQLNVAVKAEKARYAVRDNAQVNIAVRDPSGKPARSADVAFVAVDEALLQLMPNESWELLDAMMGERTLDVVTSTAQMQVVGKRHYGKKAVEAGGGGGDASGINRENFQPVLLWKGHVPLDAQGRARVSVPLSDSLSSFRLVAIATDGAQLFGAGETTIRTAQNLTLYSGLPPLVRTGDWYSAVFTLRNGSDHPMTVTATPKLEPASTQGRPLTLTLAAGKAGVVRWNLHAPQSPGTLKWTVSARSADGKDADSLTVTQEVAPAVPVEVWAAGLWRVGEGAQPTIAIPADALPGGWVSVALSDTLAPPLDGVKRYMAEYPYGCFEQKLSRIVATGDSGGWTALAGALPTYLDHEGLLRYWPVADMQGSPELTAYTLAMTSAAGLPIPDEARAKMVAALRDVVTARLSRDRRFSADERLVRISALTALARAGVADATLIGSVDMAPADMPTSTLADWIVALDRLPRAPRAAQLRAAAEQELRHRLVYEATRLDLADQRNAPWWMMVSGDEMAIKALDAVLGKRDWAAEAPRMMTGVAQRQWRGHWDTTPANAWGTVVSRRFGGLYPAKAVVGTTQIALGGKSLSAAWPLAADAAPMKLPLTAGPITLSQSGGAGPWAVVSVHAAVPLKAPLFAGYRLTRSVSIVSARRKDRLTQGDVLRIRLTIEATAPRTWVVLSDPLPPGATVVSDLGGQSSLLRQGEASEGAWPAYVEKDNRAWRAYYDWLPGGTTSIDYTVRLNGAGHFTLPPARAEAMYAPSIRAQLPVPPMTIWAP